MTYSLAAAGSDRTRPLKDGRVSIGGATWNFIDEPIEAMFSRAFADAPYEVSELSFSNYLISVANGTARYIGLPIFTSRSFRHSAIYVREGSGIKAPADLVGRRVGVREFSNTAALIVRGMLSDEYGVTADSIEWFVGDIDTPERQEVPIPKLTSGTSLTPIVGEDLSAMLLDGRLDALIAYQPPRCFAPGLPVFRMFPDYPKVEEDYFRRTGRFPIMHLIGVRKDVAQSDPDVLIDLAAAFAEAKRCAFQDLFDQQALKIMLPWVVAEAERTVAIRGADFWAYGLEANRGVLEAQIGYSFDQGLIAARPELSELFVTTERIEELLRA